MDGQPYQDSTQPDPQDNDSSHDEDYYDDDLDDPLLENDSTDKNTRNTTYSVILHQPITKIII